jgi:hypothetical protein
MIFKKFALSCLSYLIPRLVILGSFLLVYEVVVALLFDKGWIGGDDYLWLLTWTFEISINGTAFLLISAPFQVWSGKFDEDEDVQPPREVTSSRPHFPRKRKSWKETIKKFFRLLP